MLAYLLDVIGGIKEQAQIAWYKFKIERRVKKEYGEKWFKESKRRAVIRTTTGR